jgi:hypothetical protein
VREGVRALGLEIRAGLHTGECELAGAGEVFVSSTVKDLVAGAGIAARTGASTGSGACRIAGACTP